MGRPEGAPAPQQPVLVLDMEGGANGADPSTLGFARLQVTELCPAMFEEQKVLCRSLTLDEAMVRELGKRVLACRAQPEGFSPAFICR